MKVPKELVGKKVSEEAVRAWARDQLHGEDAKLTVAVIGRIRRGEVSKVKLEPMRSGFFLPDKTFVPTFDKEIAIGGDLDVLESEIEAEEADWGWIDQENARFNKARFPNGVPILEVWAHGKRITDYVVENGRRPFPFHERLASRGGADGYSLRTHQIAADFYSWKSTLSDRDPVASWTWQLVDATLKFSKEPATRNRIEVLVCTVWQALEQRQIARLLRGDHEQLADGSTATIAARRTRLKRGETLAPEEIAQLAEFAGSL